MQSTLKITTRIAKVYNDVVFGGISWSCDEQKIVFIGEVPEIAEFKNPFDALTALKESKEENESKIQHWQEEKFEYKNDFGEGLVGKKQPGIFVFDLIENRLE